MRRIGNINTMHLLRLILLSIAVWSNIGTPIMLCNVYGHCDGHEKVVGVASEECCDESTACSIDTCGACCNQSGTVESDDAPLPLTKLDHGLDAFALTSFELVVAIPILDQEQEPATFFESFRPNAPPKIGPSRAPPTLSV